MRYHVIRIDKHHPLGAWYHHHDLKSALAHLETYKQFYTESHDHQNLREEPQQGRDKMTFQVSAHLQLQLERILSKRDYLCLSTGETEVILVCEEANLCL